MKGDPKQAEKTGPGDTTPASVSATLDE